MSVVWTIVMLLVMIFVHELGHFITAKKCNVKVNEFAIGMGPKIFGWGKGETKYSLRALPIGGFCQIEGEDGDSEDERAFTKQKPIKKIAILAAGATMNIVLALIVFLIINCFVPGYYSSELGEIIPDSPMAESVFQAGDRIVKMDNTSIRYFDDISLFLGFTDGSPIEITVKRDGEKITQTITPAWEEETKRYILGFYTTYKEHTIGSRLKNAWFDTLYSAKCVFLSLKWLFTGKVGLSDMSGPVGIVVAVDSVSEMTQTVRERVLSILNMMGLISVNLGIFNLLPLPALDGGRIVFAAVEGITKKKIKPAFEAAFHAAGLALLMLLALYVTVSDIQKLFLK